MSYSLKMWFISTEETVSWCLWQTQNDIKPTVNPADDPEDSSGLHIYTWCIWICMCISDVLKHSKSNWIRIKHYDIEAFLGKPKFPQNTLYKKLLQRFKN